MKIKFVLVLFVLSSTLFANDMDDAVVLHPRLSYRAESEGEFTVVDYHLFGDKVQSNGEIKEHKDSKYVYLEKEGKPYYTYFYFVVQNSTQGVILEESFIYSTDDLSTITEDRVEKLTFVAIDKSSLNKELLKVSYLNKNDKGWFISEGWIKKTAISTKKDDWGTAIKFFNATQVEKKEDRESILGTVFMFNKNSVFIDLIQKMLDEDHLNISDREYGYDPLFKVIEDVSIHFQGVVYSEPDETSEILLEDLTGVKKISALKRLNDPVIEDSIERFWYYIDTFKEDPIQGWILR